MSKMSNGMKYGLGLLGAAVTIGVAAAVLGDDDEASGDAGDGECGEATDRKTYRGIQYTVDVCKRDGKLNYHGVILLPMQPRLRLEQARADGPTADADAKAWIDSKFGGAQPPRDGQQQAMNVCQHLTTLLVNYASQQGTPVTEADKQQVVTSCMALTMHRDWPQASACILAAKTWPEAAVCLQGLQQQQPPMTATFAGARR